MTSPRIWPPVFQVLSRTAICNIQQKPPRYYSHAHPEPNYYYGNNAGVQAFDKYNFHLNFVPFEKQTIKNVFRNCGTCFNVTDFENSQNQLAHNVLRSMPAYQNTTTDIFHMFNLLHVQFPPSFNYQLYGKVDIADLVHNFLSISKDSQNNVVNLDNEQYHYLCMALNESIPSMTYEQLLKMISAMRFWQPSEKQNLDKFEMLKNQLDKTCLMLCTSWNTNEILLMADHWYALKLANNTSCFKDFLKHISNNLDKISPTQLVQFMFYINVTRKNYIFEKKILQQKIFDSLNLLTSDEVGIIMMGIFKSQLFLDIWLLEKVKNKTVADLDHISNHTLGAILKSLRRAFSISLHAECYQFLEKLNVHFDKFNNYVLLQVALLGNNPLVYHEKVITRICSKFAKDLSTLRLKEIERLCYVMMIYNTIPPDWQNIFDLIVEELRKPSRIEEFNQYPECFVSCINFLAFVGIFPHDLISASLQPSIFNNLIESSYISDIVELQWALNLEEGPAYFGNSIPSDLFKQLNLNFKHEPLPHHTSANFRTNQQTLSLAVEEGLRIVLGLKTDDRRVRLNYILPHIKFPDIIFLANDMGEILPLPDEDFGSFDSVDEIRAFMASAEGAASKSSSDGDLHWNAVIVVGRNNILYPDGNVKGTMVTKSRQLKSLGFNVSMLRSDKYIGNGVKKKVKELTHVVGETSLGKQQDRFELFLKRWRENAENAAEKREVKENVNNLTQKLNKISL